MLEVIPKAMNPKAVLGRMDSECVVALTEFRSPCTKIFDIVPDWDSLTIEEIAVESRHQGDMWAAIQPHTSSTLSR